MSHEKANIPGGSQARTVPGSGSMSWPSKWCCSVAPTVIRLRATERALASGASIDEAMAALRTEVHPIDDLRSTAEYRLRVTENLVRRFWSESL